MNPDKLKRSLQRFFYEKPSKVTRGLLPKDYEELDQETQRSDKEDPVTETKESKETNQDLV